MRAHRAVRVLLELRRARAEIVGDRVGDRDLVGGQPGDLAILSGGVGVVGVGGGVGVGVGGGVGGGVGADDSAMQVRPVLETA